MVRFAAAALASFFLIAADSTLEPKDYAADALSIEAIVNDHYAYPDRLPNGRFVLTGKLKLEAAAVRDPGMLVRFSERALMLLADHHAITGGSRRDSFAVFPSFGDLWIEPQAEAFSITAVRKGSPADLAGVAPGDQLARIEGVPMADAVQAFWADLGTASGGDRDGYAARVLAAGRRDRPRVLTITKPGKAPRQLTLPSLYSVSRQERPPVSSNQEGSTVRIKFNDSLGDNATVAAFDAAMVAVPKGNRLIIDLTDTPSGGNTVVARAVLGWFVNRPTFYQVHRLPAEERRTGIPRQWVEQVLPRAGKFRQEKPTVLVGRWTGSMGEGMAIAFDHFGSKVRGDPMAALLGAIYDYRYERSGQVIKVPTERLMAVDGTPRERFRPTPLRSTR